MEYLPIDVLQEIGSYLGQKEIGRIRSTSQLFNQRSWSCLTKATINGNFLEAIPLSHLQDLHWLHVDATALTTKLLLLTNLRTLDLDTHLDAEAIAIINQLTQVYSFDVNFATKKGAIELPSIFETHLTALVIRDIGSSVRGLHLFTNLEHLSLRDFCENTLRENALVELTKLTKLELFGVSSFSPILLASRLTNLEVLLTDDLCVSGLDGDYSILGNLTKLSHLEIETLGLVTSETVGRLTQLTRLCIRSAAYNYEDFDPEFQHFSALTNLVQLVYRTETTEDLKLRAFTKLKGIELEQLPADLIHLQSLRRLTIQLASINKLQIESVLCRLTQVTELELLQVIFDTKLFAQHCTYLTNLRSIKYTPHQTREFANENQRMSEQPDI